MRTFQSQRPAVQRPAPSSLHSLDSSAVSPLSTASITLAALLFLTIPVCNSAPAELEKAATDRTQLLNQVDSDCSSYLSADLKFLESDVLRELCILMLVQKSKGLKVQGSKRCSWQVNLSFPSSTDIHRVDPDPEWTKIAELQGPGGIQSRGYFLYRPRNGRRSLEYE